MAEIIEILEALIQLRINKFYQTATGGSEAGIDCKSSIGLCDEWAMENDNDKLHRKQGQIRQTV